MSFASLGFFLFLAVTFGCYTVAPQRLRWLVLLVASYHFYASLKHPHLLVILVAVTAISYAAGLAVPRAATGAGKKWCMIVAVAANLAVLVGVRYLPFLAESVNALATALGGGPPLPVFSLLTSVGISFYVFQGIAYVVDVYLETTEPERHLGRFALGMSFFPKLLQGPIERGASLHPQLETLRAPQWENLLPGLNLFLFGMLKKVVVADRLASFVDPVYAQPGSYHGLSLVIATYLFALQIYFDFSGYTDMALGIARGFNIRLTQNFNAPYTATSTAEFWRRWHISFSSWILDYIFRPLQMQWRHWPFWGTPLALLVTFLLSGLWHGGSWCFVVWGGLHGLYLFLGALWRGPQRKWHRYLGIENHPLLKVWQRLLTFHMVCLAWVFFRSAKLQDALHVVKSSLCDTPQSLVRLAGAPGAWQELLLLGQSPAEAVAAAAAVLLALLLGASGRRFGSGERVCEQEQWLSRLPWWSYGFVYGVYIYLIAICGTAAQGFIYQQF